VIEQIARWTIRTGTTALLGDLRMIERGVLSASSSHPASNGGGVVCAMRAGVARSAQRHALRDVVSPLRYRDTVAVAEER